MPELIATMPLIPLVAIAIYHNIVMKRAPLRIGQDSERRLTRVGKICLRNHILFQRKIKNILKTSQQVLKFC